MSSNNSAGSSGSGDPIEAFATPYFNWLKDDVFPILVGTTNLLIILLGTILNSILLHALRKKRLDISSGKVYVINLVVLDFTAYVFILLPSIIVAFCKKWNLSDFMCKVNGDFVTACFLMTFYLYCLIFIERWLKITNAEAHYRTLARTKVSVTIVVLLWIVFFSVGLLPLTGLGVLEYISHQYLCNINHHSNNVGMNLLFVFGMFVPCLASVVFMVLIVRKKNNIIKSLSDLQKQFDSIKMNLKKSKRTNNINNDFNHNLTMASRTDPRTVSVSQINPTTHAQGRSLDIEVVSSEIIHNDGLPGSVLSRSEVEIKDQLFTKDETLREDVTTQNIVQHVYQRSEEYDDIHITITYAIMWGISVLMWCPYLILCYLDQSGNVVIWGGWYSMAIPVAHMTYVVKPIVYLSHNRVFRDAAYKTLPENVRSRSEKVRKVFSKTLNRIDDVIFLQRSNTSNDNDQSVVNSRDENELKTFKKSVARKTLSSVTNEAEFDFSNTTAETYVTIN